jgi:hypothetical protein
VEIPVRNRRIASFLERCGLGFMLERRLRCTMCGREIPIAGMTETEMLTWSRAHDALFHPEEQNAD